MHADMPCARVQLAQTSPQGLNAAGRGERTHALARTAPVPDQSVPAAHSGITKDDIGTRSSQKELNKYLSTYVSSQVERVKHISRDQITVCSRRPTCPAKGQLTHAPLSVLVSCSLSTVTASWFRCMCRSNHKSATVPPTRKTEKIQNSHFTLTPIVAYRLFVGKVPAEKTPGRLIMYVQVFCGYRARSQQTCMARCYATAQGTSSTAKESPAAASQQSSRTHSKVTGCCGPLPSKRAGYS